MKRYTDWNWTPLAWHSFLKYVNLPLGFVIGLLGIFGARYGLGEVQPYTLVSMGLTVATEIGLIRRRWWGPCCLLAGYGITVVYGFYLASAGAAIESTFYVSQGIGLIISGALMLGLNWVYYQKRRALFSPEPVWLEAENAATTPKNTEYAYAASQPEAAQAPKAAGGYNTIYQEKGPENTVAEAASVKAPEAREEPEDGVTLLLQLQAEEETKRAEEAYSERSGAPKKKSAPMWSVLMLGALCVVLAVTAGVLGWQWQKAAGQRDSSNELLLEAVGQLNEKDDKISELAEEREESVKEAANLRLENKDLQDSLAFWEKNAVVMEYDSNWKPFTYHTTNCPLREFAIRDGWYAVVDYSIIDGFDVYKCFKCRAAQIPD